MTADLAQVADRLTRAAAELEALKGAGLAAFLRALDRHSAAALVPALRDAAAAALGAAACGYPPDRPWTGCDVVLDLHTFAARVLREEEEESGG